MKILLHKSVIISGKHHAAGSTVFVDGKTGSRLKERGIARGLRESAAQAGKAAAESIADDSDGDINSESEE